MNGRAAPFALWFIPLLVALIVSMAYMPGATGGLFYDDISNLGGLSSLANWADLRTFVLSGTAGPLGRPIALASFLPHADGWPENSAEVVRINVILHIFNGSLLFWLGYLILKLRGRTPPKRAFYIALSAATLWLVMPLVASTSLIAIQRMTSLAAFFGLLGLIGFVWAYRLQQARPRLALAIQGLALGLGTGLAMFTKETGALIPVFALVIDAVLINTMPAHANYRRIRRGVLLFGLLALLVYLSPIFRDWFQYDHYRGFSPFERMLTQPIILWQYLQLAFFPTPTGFGPFHDHVRVVDGLLLPTIAVSGFLLLTALGIWLRQRSPWLLFALLWFFTGHLLESTVIPLELFFEHRNYLAVYGLCLALAYGAWNLPGGLARVGPAIFATYVFMLWLILLGLTTIWGNPHGAAESWAAQNPSSARAALHLATLDRQALGGATIAIQGAEGPSTVAYPNRALDRTADACADCIDVRMQAALYACNAEGETAVRRRFDDLITVATSGRHSKPAVEGLFPLRDLINADGCAPLTLLDGQMLTHALLANPAFARRGDQARLHFVAAAFADDLGDLEKAIEHLDRAERIGPTALPVLQYQVHLNLRESRLEEALAAIERRRSFVGVGPSQISKTDLDVLVQMVEAQSKNGEPQDTDFP